MGFSLFKGQTPAQQANIKVVVITSVTLIIAAVVALFPYIHSKFLTATPAKFTVVNPFTKSDTTIQFQPHNASAEKGKDLNIEFDGVQLMNAGHFTENSGKYSWQFNLAENNIDPSMLKDGKHILRLGFIDENYTDTLNIFLSSHPPSVSAKISQLAGTEDHRINVVASSNTRSESDTLRVNVTFYTDNHPQQISLPVKQVIQQETGDYYFEFEASVQGLPVISPKDKKYSELFFAFEVKDQAGNQYYEEMSYAQYMAPGDKVFGVSNIADVEFKRKYSEVKTELTSTFRITPNLRRSSKLSNGQPAIVLQVTGALDNTTNLKWHSNISDKNVPTLIYRGDKKIGASFSNKFTDKEIVNDKPIYHIEQMGKDGITYTSSSVIRKDYVGHYLEELNATIKQKNDYFNKKLMYAKLGLEDNVKSIKITDGSRYIRINCDSAHYDQNKNILIHFAVLDDSIIGQTSKLAITIDGKLDEELASVMGLIRAISSQSTVLYLPKESLKRGQRIHTITLGFFLTQDLNKEIPSLYQVSCQFSLK